MRMIDADALERSLRDVMLPDVPTYLNVITGIIKAMPTVDAEPVRHGRWREKPPKYGYGKSRFSECSLCKALGRKSWKYCPGCGAKMDGGEKNGETDG